MTDEHMQELERRIDAMMSRYEMHGKRQDRIILDCMVKDYEAKLELRIRHEQ